MVIQVGLIVTLLAPQLWAALRGFSPAAHLTFLLLSLCLVISTFIFALPAALSFPAQGQSVTLKLSYIGFAVVGLTGLVPLFWALQQMFPSYRYALITALAQALGLAFTAVLLTLAAGSAVPSVLEWTTLALVIALYGAGLHVVHYGTLE
jgi:hypothetical protein